LRCVGDDLLGKLAFELVKGGESGFSEHA
jgi:hypothetical protein